MYIILSTRNWKKLTREAFESQEISSIDCIRNYDALNRTIDWQESLRDLRSVLKSLVREIVLQQRHIGYVPSA